MTTKKAPENRDAADTVDPASIAAAQPDVSRLMLEEKLSGLTAEFEKAVKLRDQCNNQARQYDMLAVRIEGAITVVRELLTPPATRQPEVPEVHDMDMH